MVKIKFQFLRAWPQVKNTKKVGLGQIEKWQKSIFKNEKLIFKFCLKNLLKNTWPKEQFLLTQNVFLLVKNQSRET